MSGKKEWKRQLTAIVKKLTGLLVTSRATLLGWICFCTVLGVALVLSTTCVCFAVSVDGQSIGQTGSHQEFEEALAEAETQAEEILGRECCIADSLDVSAGLGTQVQSAQEIKDSILETVDGISKLYVITVDGTPVAALRSGDALDSILDSILDSYSTPDTVSATFKENVKVEYTFANEALISTPGKIAKLLSPDNVSSPYALTVITRDEIENVSAEPYRTEYKYDDSKYSDDETVLVDGRGGLKNVTIQTTRENGIETSSGVVREKIISAPVTEVISVGTKPGSRTDSTGSYIYPADAPISSYFGGRNVSVGSSNHKGIDLDGDTGDNVWAADGGEVIMAQSYYGFGLMVQIRHDNGDITYYAHLSKILVSVGDRVAQGDMVGFMGMTGTASGSHLHFEVHPGGGDAVDPLVYLGER